MRPILLVAAIALALAAVPFVPAAAADPVEDLLGPPGSDPCRPNCEDALGPEPSGCRPYCFDELD